MAKIENQETVQEDGSDAVDDNNNNNTDENDNEDNKAGGMSGGKYQLRPRAVQPRRRCDSEWSNLQEAVRHKQRPPPLSRYRRKTANARERYRMRQINTAFESLRGVLPSWVCSRRAASEMTKITTLRLASAYIRSLQDILEGNTHPDTCSWVLSSVLEDASELQQPQLDLHHNATTSPGKFQQSPHHTPADSDFVSLLCTSSNSEVFQSDSEALSYLAPMSETETVALWLGPEPEPQAWPDGHHSPLVS
ncbi:helix-loop-helix protein delilah-like [Panulirus ornatus]|uniref:helix-loop-helix protein delilah-like n=1 Tax=Panulirus ornatus TaxID=150431 RepID=UPI003A852963